MAKYVLKRGVFLRQAGLPPLCENTLRGNDDLADKYLSNDPSLAKYFSTLPGKTEFIPPPVTAKPPDPIVIIEPKEPEVKVEKPKIEEVIPVEVIKKVVRKQRKRVKHRK